MAVKSDFVIKFERARGHLDDLEKQLAAWANSGHHTVKNERDPAAGPDRFKVSVISDLVPREPFGALIGDVLHNLRGALDHLAFALAESYAGRPLPDDIAKESEFPIFERDDARAIAKKIRGIHPDAQAVIKSLQPYHKGKDCSLDKLWILHALSNIDKHRLLIVGTVSNVAAGFRLSGSCNFQDLDVQVYDTMIEGETVVIRYRAIPIDRDKAMHVEFDPLLQIAFKTPLALNGKGVVRTLNDICDYIQVRAFGSLGKFL